MRTDISDALSPCNQSLTGLRAAISVADKNDMLITGACKLNRCVRGVIANKRCRCDPAVTEIFHFILVAGENGVNTNFLTEITETLQSDALYYIRIDNKVNLQLRKFTPDPAQRIHENIVILAIQGAGVPHSLLNKGGFAGGVSTGHIKLQCCDSMLYIASNHFSGFFQRRPAGNHVINRAKFHSAPPFTFLSKI